MAWEMHWRTGNQKEELSDPVQAARILLNLSEDPNEVSHQYAAGQQLCGNSCEHYLCKKNRKNEKY